MKTEKFVASFLEILDETFPGRVWFCGLQGSRARDEHRANSDFDMVVILDVLSVADIGVYRQMVRSLPESELACGFLAGREDIEAWDPADLLHLCFDTRPLRGNLDPISGRIDRAALRQAAWSAACAICHGCVHNMVYERDPGILRGLLKHAKFLIQTQIFARTGQFARTIGQLLDAADAAQHQILELHARSVQADQLPFAEVSDILFTWVQNVVRAHGGID